MIKAIETYYDGYRFRSRLEARWAVFFKESGIEYEYEPEGFILSDGNRYLPDFYLPKHKTYVEVKRPNAFKKTKKDDGEWVTFNDKYHTFIMDAVKEKNYVWFVFGDPYGVLLTDVKEENDRVCNNQFFFFPEECKAHIVDRNVLESGYGCDDDGYEQRCCTCDHFMGSIASTQILWVYGGTLIYWQDPDSSYSPYYFDDRGLYPDLLLENRKFEEIHNVIQKNIANAKKARMARFEYGERG